jgi:hypothetical protein
LSETGYLEYHKINGDNNREALIMAEIVAARAGSSGKHLGHVEQL